MKVELIMQPCAKHEVGYHYCHEKVFFQKNFLGRDLAIETSVIDRLKVYSILSSVYKIMDTRTVVYTQFTLLCHDVLCENS